ncbi:unnamed protein product [Enterobius vermicularis]|uniref:G-patch domain-containing protein n=1 Tax=Enterobius vermicularis TaxID=51028 RepID=A0A0N4V5D6_ENTVE|nr:unnamed protein product [Enterobius vermicularis]
MQTPLKYLSKSDYLPQKGDGIVQMSRVKGQIASFEMSKNAAISSADQIKEPILPLTQSAYRVTKEWAMKGLVCCTSSAIALFGDTVSFSGLIDVSIADMILETVCNSFWENHLPGFVYHDKYKMFYNSESGYYYDQNTSLFYHPSTRCYYFYDENSRNFIFHSRVPAEHLWSSRKAKNYAVSLHGESYVTGMDQEEVDIFECLYDLISQVCANVSDDSCFEDEVGEKDSEDEIKQFIEDERIEYPPCIRLVGENGDLHIVTIDGAFLGFGDQFDICLKLPSGLSSELSQKAVAEIRYRNDDKEFELRPLLNTVPLYLQGSVICEDTVGVLKHSDECAIGLDIFRVHIHHGSNTCNGCEPGLFSIPVSTCNFTQESTGLTSEQQRRRTLKALKAEYGLLGEEFERQKEMKRWNLHHPQGFYNKAIKRPVPRSPQLVDPVYSACVAKPVSGTSTESVILRSNSVVSRLDESNKGYKLLKNLGWKEGSGLGKDNSGIQQPLFEKVKNDRSGLGLDTSLAEETCKPKKLRILEITRQRFDCACEEEK